MAPAAEQKRLAAGVVAGAAASTLLSPIVQVVDVAVVKVAASAGRQKLSAALVEGALAWARNPAAQISNKAFQLCWMVYFLTYVSANTVKTICAKLKRDSTLPNLFLVTLVNMAASMYKDAALAKANKKQSDERPRSFPMLSYVLFFVRDVLTIGSGFVMPSRVTSMLTSSGLSASVAGSASQLLCPAGIQFITMPFHFFSLDVFNFESSNFAERWTRMAAAYPNVTSIRVLRGIASFGLGGVSNTRCMQLMDAA